MQTTETLNSPTVLSVKQLQLHNIEPVRVIKAIKYVKAESHLVVVDSVITDYRPSSTFSHDASVQQIWWKYLHQIQRC